MEAQSLDQNTNTSASKVTQFSTFYVANRMYGVNVTRVQEIVKPMEMTTVPLAPDYVRGLINLRGQVATALGLREMFKLNDVPPDELMNVVCKFDGSLISFQVDEIGDVVEIDQGDFDQTPQTLPENIRRFMSGVYRVNDQLLSLIDIDLIMKYLNDKTRKIEEKDGQ